MADRLRVFLADDHSLVRDGLRALINAQPDMLVVGEATDGESACDQVLALGPDVVLMDVSLPKLNGGQATERLSKARPEIKVVALTFHSDKTYVRQLLEAGAAGYVLKRGAPDEVIQAIRTVAGGGTYVDPEVADTPPASLVPDAAAAGDLRPHELSEPEATILRLIARGHSIKSISAQLDLSVKTVETYRASALAKLGLTTRAEIVQFALRQDWL
jgi:DNA-binding NarL/FixJ family response regulator